MDSIFDLLKNLNIKTSKDLNQYISKLPNDRILQDKERQYQEWLKKSRDTKYIFEHEEEYVLNEIPENIEFRLVNNLSIYNFDFHVYKREAMTIIEGKELYMENRIIDLEMLNLNELTKISFKNCIFKGEVSITSRNPISEIYIDNCIFLKLLSIKDIKSSKDMSLIIYRSNINRLIIQNLLTEEIRITSSKIFLWCFFGAQADTLVVNDNQIEILEASSNLIKKNKSFDSRQININNIGFRIKKALLYRNKLKTDEEIECQINLFESKISKYINSINENDNLRMANSTIRTIEFLEDVSDLKERKREYFNALFKRRLFNQDNKILKFVVWITGGFVKPLNFAIIALFIYLFFAFVYMMPIMKFNTGEELYTVKTYNVTTEVRSTSTPKSLELLDAFYFSGITFTTIGYGDICPLGVAKALVIIEGVLGVTVTSAFLISFVNRYIE